MSKSIKQITIKIDDLPQHATDLTPEQAKGIYGGWGAMPILIGPTVIRVPTAYGTHDTITKTSHWDYKDDDVTAPSPRPSPSPGPGPTI